MVKLEFLKALPRDVPQKLTVYSTALARVDQKGLTEIARRLKMLQAAPRPEFIQFRDWTALRQGPSLVAVSRRSGAIRFQDDDRYGCPAEKPFSIPEPRLAELARQFVDEAKLLAMPAHDLKVGKIVYSRLQAISVEGEMTPEQILDAGVVFVREIDGVPVVGPGGLVTIYISADESVVAGLKVWRDIKGKAGTAKILPPDYALEQLQGRIEKRGIQGLVKVLKADFCYFEAGAIDVQRYLEPTYAFVFETRMDGFLYKSIELIPATEHPRQLWKHRKRRPEPEVVRTRKG